MRVWWGALWTLGRPRLLPFVLGLPLLGYALAHWDRALPLTGAARLPWVLAGWTLLHLGTLWLNAVVDRDEGPVLFGRPTTPPPRLTWVAVGALVLAPLVCLPAGPVPALCGAACALLAGLYSWPGALLKAHAIGGPVVNGLGYGLLSPLAGWGVCGTPMTPRLGVLYVLLAAAVLGTYFAAQAFQEAEDGARGYRTLVVTHGPARTIDMATVWLVVSLGGLMTLAIIGWVPRPLLLAVPLLPWVLLWLYRWRNDPGGGSERHARELLRRLVWLGLVLVGLALMEYTREALSGELVAGLGTVGGHPPDLMPRS